MTTAWAAHATHQQLVLTMDRYGENEGELRTEPDTGQRTDRYPGGNEEKQARRAQNAQITSGYRSQVAALDNLHGSRSQEHTEGNKQIERGQQAKGKVAQAVPGNSAQHNACRDATTGRQFIQLIKRIRFEESWAV